MQGDLEALNIRFFRDFRVRKNLTVLISSQSSGASGILFSPLRASETFSFHQGAKAPHFPFFHIGYSIDTPSILHRWSIVSMEERWSIDGELMEDLLREDVVKISDDKIIT